MKTKNYNTGYNDGHKQGFEDGLLAAKNAPKRKQPKDQSTSWESRFDNAFGEMTGEVASEKGEYVHNLKPYIKAWIKTELASSQCDHFKSQLPISGSHENGLEARELLENIEKEVERLWVTKEPAPNPAYAAYGFSFAQDISKYLKDLKSQLAHAAIPVTPKSTIDLLKKGELKSQLSGEEKK